MPQLLPARCRDWCSAGPADSTCHSETVTLQMTLGVGAQLQPCAPGVGAQLCWNPTNDIGGWSTAQGSCFQVWLGKLASSQDCHIFHYQTQEKEENGWGKQAAEDDSHEIATICFIIVSMHGHLHYTVYTSSSEHLPAVLHLYQSSYIYFDWKHW